jgi:hypothetical protein
VRHLLVALLGIGLALGTACGGGDGDTPGGGASPASTTTSEGSPPGGGSALQDACTLLSEAQVNEALGDDEVATTRSEPPTQALSQCQWEGSNSGNRYLHLTLRTAQNATSVFESNYRTVAGAVSVPGIGDEAYALPGMDTPNNYRLLTMAALTSSLYIQVDIAGPNRPDDEALSVLTAAMQQVVANLQ